MIQFFLRNGITANQLTVLRVLLIPCMFWVIQTWPETHWVLFSTWIVYVFAGMTDYWDGIMAREQGHSKLGQLLDPVADKLMIASLLILMVSLGRAPAGLVVLLIGRDFAVNGLRSVAAAEGRIIDASSGGKFKMFSQLFATGFLMIHYETLWLPCHDIGIVLLWIATGLSLWSGADYFHAYYRSISSQS